VTPQGEPLTREQVEAICRRALGPETPLLGLEQFRGGTHNQVYRVSVPGRLPLILRVAPPDSADLAWDERDLMRREQAIRPAFAATAHLMPQVVFEDFSRAVIDRDYLLQTFIEGQRWEDLAGELPAEAGLALWAQFGSLLRQIHDTAGDVFGDPPPGQSFVRWSDAVEHRLSQTTDRLHGVGLDWAAPALEAALRLARVRRLLVDEVAVPRLLHGDLWLFNLLVRETPDGWRIVGVLDADRASWGDPLADWTLFVLAKLDAPALAPGVERFWDAYGPLERTRGATFRARLYEVLHIGTALAWAARERDQATLERGRRELPEAAARLAEEPD
jgi:aminoglycoside phosphotransferase (APT) family kinase protein